MNKLVKISAAALLAVDAQAFGSYWAQYRYSASCDFYSKDEETGGYTKGFLMLNQIAAEEEADFSNPFIFSGRVHGVAPHKFVDYQLVNSCEEPEDWYDIVTKLSDYRRNAYVRNIAVDYEQELIKYQGGIRVLLRGDTPDIDEK